MICALCYKKEEMPRLLKNLEEKIERYTKVMDNLAPDAQKAYLLQDYIQLTTNYYNITKNLLHELKCQVASIDQWEGKL